MPETHAAEFSQRSGCTLVWSRYSSNPPAAAVLHVDIQRQARVFFGVSVDVEQERVDVAGLGIGAGGGGDVDREGAAEVDQIAAVERVVFHRLHSAAGGGRAGQKRIAARLG